MADWVEVAKEEELDEQLGVRVNGHKVALFRVEDDDQIYALDDICSHEYSLLSEGEIWDDEVYCPKHGSRFDIRTGSVRSFPAFKPVNTYEVKVEDGIIYVNLERD